MSRFQRSLAVIVLALLSLGMGPCKGGSLLFYFVSPGFGQLSLLGENIQVELQLPPFAVEESLVFERLDGSPIVVDDLQIDGSVARGTISGLSEARHLILAKVDVEMLELSFSLGAATWVELAALANLEECEVLNQVECLLPFPSSRFLEEADTETGYRVRYPAVGMPGVPNPLDPAAFDGNDGFSPMVQILTHFPGGVDPELSDASRLDPETRSYDARSLESDSPTLLFDVDAGMQPVLHWIERDTPALAVESEREVLYLRPGKSLTPGHRYIVAMRDLVHPDGTAVQPEPAFAALRNSRPTTIPAVEARREQLEEIFAMLEGAGIDRRELLLAFDFMVQSDEDLSREMLAMRDRSFEWLSQAEGQTFEVFPFVENPGEDEDHSVQNDCSAEGETIWRRVHGTFQVPLFLSADPLLESTTPGKLVDDDDDGLPDIQGTMDANFSVVIPCSVLEEGGAPLAPIIVGHGLFGNGEGVAAIANTFSQSLQDRGLGDFERIAGATDYLGLSSFDFPGFVINGLIFNLNNFAALPDRLRQGMTNTLVLARMLKEGRFNVDPAFQTPGGSGVLAGPEAELNYFGISLGGIQGLFFTAFSPDVANVAVDIPAGNFSVMVQRSSAIGLVSEFINFVVSDPMTQALLWGLAGELWARGENAAYLHHITRDPLPGSGEPKKLLMTVARYDGVVPNIATEAVARTLGLPNLRSESPQQGSAVGGFVDIPDVAGPLGPGDPDFVGAQVWYDLGMYDLQNPEHEPFIPPLGNVPPEGEEGGGLQVVSPCEPHGRTFSTPAERLQIVRWLQQPGEAEGAGSIANTCDGFCDSLATGGGFALEELDNGRNEPCDPVAEPDEG